MLLNAKAKYAIAFLLAFIAAAWSFPYATVVLLTVTLDAGMIVSKVLPKAQEIPYTSTKSKPKSTGWRKKANAMAHCQRRRSGENQGVQSWLESRRWFSLCS